MICQAQKEQAKKSQAGACAAAQHYGLAAVETAFLEKAPGLFYSFIYVDLVHDIFIFQILRYAQDDSTTSLRSHVMAVAILTFY